MNPFLKEYKTERSDVELLEKAKDGDQASLESLLRKHQPYIYNIAWKMVQNPNDAADLTQEALIKITVNLSKFKVESSFRTWAYRIVVNHFLNEKKRGNESFFNSFDDMRNALESVPDQPMTPFEQEENQAIIREMQLSCMSGMLLCLNREQRMVFIIGEMFKGDHNIGSEIMGISRDNFRAKLKKSRRDLSSFMQGHCGLVNKDNPCRCHKKVKVAVENKVLNAKELLYNKDVYSTFQQEIKADAAYMYDEFGDRYADLYQKMTFRNDFDKQTFIENILNDFEWKKRMKLN